MLSRRSPIDVPARAIFSSPAVFKREAMNNDGDVDDAVIVDDDDASNRKASK